MESVPLVVSDILDQGFKAFESLDSERQLVFLICVFEADICKDGWYQPFFLPEIRYYGILKDGLLSIGDTDSVAVLQAFEDRLHTNGVPMERRAVWEFAYGAREDWKKSRDYGEDFMKLYELRWNKLRIWLTNRGFDLR
jgi:hypothetical protein